MVTGPGVLGDVQLNGKENQPSDVIGQTTKASKAPATKGLGKGEKLKGAKSKDKDVKNVSIESVVVEDAFDRLMVS